ncbi:hypothetical protein [Gracilibacillus sp. YIM 98692]|uniref:hypothetical protein n=1 Tax=Gracilibacillus sp. YIM 98692 TaxID=2663532 RepID=UPI0013D81C56|nr:hypothetical protein [Gracilibacillus sp. YIM 98692]
MITHYQCSSCRTENVFEEQKKATCNSCGKRLYIMMTIDDYLSDKDRALRVDIQCASNKWF